MSTAADHANPEPARTSDGPQVNAADAAEPPRCFACGRNDVPVKERGYLRHGRVVVCADCEVAVARPLYLRWNRPRHDATPHDRDAT